MADNREGQDREGQEPQKVTPDTPETPETPETPATPEAASTSDTPETPVVAENAATPETPETPATPAETGTGIEGSKIMGNGDPNKPFANTVGVEQGDPVVATPAAVNGPGDTATAEQPAEQAAETPVETPVETPAQTAAQVTPETPAEETPATTTAAPATEAAAEEDAENAPIKINGPDTNEVEAEKAEAAKKAQVDPTATATTPQNTTDKPETVAADDMADDQPEVSRYRDLFHKKHFGTLQERWDGLQDVPQFQDALGENGEIRKSKYGFELHFENGKQHTIEWHESLRGSGSEFIGMTRRTALFDKDDAFNVVSASRARGWKTLNVHGTDDQKAMLWVEAQLQGIDVTNYKPPKGHPAYDELAARAGEQMDKTPGVSNGEMGIPVIPAYAPSPEEEAAKIAANKQKAQENAGKDAQTPPANTDADTDAAPEARDMSAPAQETAQNDGAEEVAQTATPAALDTAAPANTDKADATSTIAGGKLKDLGRGGNLGATEEERDADFLAFADQELGGDQQQLAVISARLSGDKNAGPVPQQVLDAAEEKGVAIPEELKDEKPAAETPAAKPQDREIPTTELTAEQQLDRAIANEGNTPEVRDGLRDLKQAIMDKKITQDDLSSIKLGGTAEGLVTAEQYDTFAKQIEQKVSAPAIATVAQVKNTNTGGPARKM